MSISVPIVAFIFVCIIFPHIVKNKAQFYMAFAVLLVILCLDVVVELTGGGAPGLARFFRVLRDVLWIGDFLLLVLATGGLSLHELSGELKGAYEVMRRGEDKPTVVIPKSVYADQIKPPAPAGPAPAQPAPIPPPTKTEDAPGTIPLE